MRSRIFFAVALALAAITFACNDDCSARAGTPAPCPCPATTPKCGTSCDPNGMPALCIYGGAGPGFYCKASGVWEEEGYVDCVAPGADAGGD